MSRHIDVSEGQSSSGTSRRRLGASLAVVGAVAIAAVGARASDEHSHRGFNRRGDILIADQVNHRVIIVNHATPASIAASHGNLNAPGYGTMNTSQGLFAPYDAKVIGDYTDPTPPFDHDHDADN